MAAAIDSGNRYGRSLRPHHLRLRKIVQRSLPGHLTMHLCPDLGTVVPLPERGSKPTTLPAQSAPIRGPLAQLSKERRNQDKISPDCDGTGVEGGALAVSPAAVPRNENDLIPSGNRWHSRHRDHISCFISRLGFNFSRRLCWRRHILRHFRLFDYLD